MSDTSEIYLVMALPVTFASDKNFKILNITINAQLMMKDLYF